MGSNSYFNAKGEMNYNCALILICYDLFVNGELNSIYFRNDNNIAKINFYRYISLLKNIVADYYLSDIDIVYSKEKGIYYNANKK